jgi:hypothetical protein
MANPRWNFTGALWHWSDDQRKFQSSSVQIPKKPGKPRNFSPSELCRRVFEIWKFGPLKFTGASSAGQMCFESSSSFFT